VRASLFQNVAFVFVSDDLEWVEKTLGNPLDDCFYIGSSLVTELKREDALRSGFDIGVDLALLSQVNHTILTYGTYGMWGALLNGGLAVLPASFSGLTKEMIEIEDAKLQGWHLIKDQDHYTKEKDTS
jgi:galactoside 2-L-fucosyltransferase 1/2